MEHPATGTGGSTPPRGTAPLRALTEGSMLYRVLAMELTCSHKIEGRSIARIVGVSSGPYAAEVGPFFRVEFVDGGRAVCFFPNDEVEVSD